MVGNIGKDVHYHGIFFSKEYNSGIDTDLIFFSPFPTATITCRPGYFRCTNNREGLAACIPDAYVCDGLSHCDDAEDELPPVCESRKYTGKG